MQRDQQHMLSIRNPQQMPAQHRPLGQIEQLRGIFLTQTGQGRSALVTGQVAQILFQQRKAAIGRGDLLHRFTVHQFKTRAQGFLAGNQAIQRCLQGSGVK